MGKKIKLTINEQVEHMKKQGITFNMVTEQEACRFLELHTYYFKIKVFAKNFDKYHSGSRKGDYIGLDFGHLKELSTLDFHLRRFILETTINIEHSLKVILNSSISTNKLEDGYSIASDFLSKYPHVQDNITSKLRSNSPYTNDLIKKYQENFASWNLCELLSFGEFIIFFCFYFEKYNQETPTYLGLLNPVKCLRNAAAHNNCLLNNLNKIITNEYKTTDQSFNTSKHLNTMVSRIEGISSNARRKKMNIAVIHDFVAMLFLFDLVVKSDPIRDKTYITLSNLMKRLYKRLDYFEKNNRITSSIEFLDKVIDFILPKGYNYSEDQKQ